MAATSDSQTRTGKLAAYVANGRFEDLPADVVAMAKMLILDSIGNMVGGATTPPGRVFLPYYEEMGGKPESTILASGTRVPCLHAVYVNAGLSNCLDFDDVYFDIGHPGATIVPPAVAGGERVGASGKDVIAAAVLGYEISLRVCDTLLDLLGYHQQVEMMATWQTFGAVTAAASVAKLSAEQVATAFGHAGMSAPVPGNMNLEPADRPVSQMKHHYGWSAMAGVQAADLAARGLRGLKHVFDSDRGYWSVIGAAKDEDVIRLTSGLGEEYLTRHVGLKAYAACRQTHATLDAVHALVARPEYSAEKVERVLVESMPSIPRAFDIRQPADVIDAEFSIPPIVALTLAGHSVSHGINLDRLRDEPVQRLMSKIELRERPDAMQVFLDERYMPATVTVELSDGTTLQQSWDAPTGEYQLPMSEERVRSKFLEVTTPIVGAEQAERYVRLVERLESLENIAELTGR
ncbi:MAG: MmgE/PrpD family protein [Chloroflexi bacterium]|nr:MmgE/PrpD family protein [Chloroflexota bacterium]